jgi:hypothetical protein
MITRTAQPLKKAENRGSVQDGLMGLAAVFLPRIAARRRLLDAAEEKLRASLADDLRAGPILARAEGLFGAKDPDSKM